MTIRVLMVDDRDLLRDGVASLLKEAPDIEMVADCHDAELAVRLAAEHRPDVVLLDAELPGQLSGPTRPVVGVISRIGRVSPRSRIILLTSNPHPLAAMALLLPPVCGYLVTDVSGMQLVTAIATVMIPGRTVVASSRRSLAGVSSLR